jgi:hypothetical protein
MKKLRAISLMLALLSSAATSAEAAQKVCFLRLTGGGFTGVSLPYKTCAGCESVKRNILKLAKARKAPAQGTCTAGMLE